MFRYHRALIDKSAMDGSRNVNCFKENHPSPVCTLHLVASGCINEARCLPLHGRVPKRADLLLFADKSPFAERGFTSCFATFCTGLPSTERGKTQPQQSRREETNSYSCV